jgi:DNA-binding transcriptional regulator YiaG
MRFFVCYGLCMNGIRIRKLRQEAGFSSMEKLAKQLKVTRACVWNWEMGRNKPTLPHAMKLLELIPGLRIKDLC